MQPELFGSWRAYPVLLVAGDLAGIAVAFHCARRAGLPLRYFAALLLALTIAAVSGAKLYGLIERDWRIGPVADEIFAGYRYPGGVLGSLLGVWLLTRFRRFTITPGELADAIAPSFGFAMAISRIGCLLAGCCSGTVSSLPWAIRFPRGTQPWRAHVHSGMLGPEALFSLPVHPLQIYFGVLSLSVAFFLLWWQRRRSYGGQLFLVFLTLEGIGKFLLEFFRFGPLPHVQYASLALASAAGALLLWRRRAGRVDCAGAGQAGSDPRRSPTTVLPGTWR